MCIGMATAHILSLSLPHSFLFFLFSSTLLAYNVHFIFNIYRKKEDIILLCIAFFLWLVSIGIYLAFAYEKEVISITLLLGFIMALYYMPTKHNFRNIPYLKSMIIALAWSIATVCLPIAAGKGDVFNYDAFLLFLERFLFVWAISIPFDIKDLKEDRQSGLTTLPMLYGLRRCLLFAIVVLLFHVGITYFHYGFGRIFFVRVVTAWYVLVVFQGISRNRPKYYYTGAIDGSMLLQPLLTMAIV
jgi:4-hydroxybenzoate polyprenyltransferase